MIYGQANIIQWNIFVD